MAPPMKPSREEMLATTFNAKLAKQGAKSRKLAESRDVNTLPDPKTYAAVMGLLGERPDEMGFSVAHPKYKEIMDVADPAFALGTAAQVVPLVKPAGQAVRGAAKALAPKAGQMVMDAAQATGMPVYGLGVVKPKGGNWLAETDDRIKRMTPYPDLSKSIAVSKARIASAENAGANPRTIADMKDDLRALERDQAVNNWTTRNLGNYIKKEMGTPDDPVRKLAEEGIVHAPHGDYIDVDSGTALAAKRTGLGFPAEGMGKSPEAKAWEELSDFAIKDTQAKNIQGADEGYQMYQAAKAKADDIYADINEKFDEMAKSTLPPGEAIQQMVRLPFKNKAKTLGREGEYEAAMQEATKIFQQSNAGKTEMLEANPWVSKLDPEERLYTGYFGDLGFDHIIDVLREDVRAGRIRPEQLSKVSMEQAVRRTYEYDLEMAKKMEHAGLTSMEGFPVHKQYPGGYKWIELKAPNKLPEKFSVSEQNGRFNIVDATTGDPLLLGRGQTLTSFKTPEEAVSAYYAQNPSILEDALKFEGDTMGHCVGGYCPDVLEGRSRIYSLRDEKGMPHVTVEVRPNQPGSKYESDWFRSQPEDIQDKITTQALAEHEAAKANRTPEEDRFTWGRALSNAIKSHIGELPSEIIQIKGKQNRAPIEDYLPYVQDFVRGGNWSQVGDFHNTGLIRKSDLIDKFTPDQLDAIGKGEYLTKGEYDDLILKALRPPEEGMKAGGEVKMKEGGIKETPVKNKAAHGMSKALGAVHKFASEPFGYKNPPGEIVSEMLGIPATARTLERMGYGEPLTTGKGMTAKPRADTMDALMAVAPLAPITKGMPVGAVIKPKGGNWLTGDVENAVARLKSPTTAGETPAQRIPRHEELLRDPSLTPESRATVEMHLNAEKKRAALDKWVDSNLTNYIKNQMATPDDPVRKLAEQGITHKSDLNNYRRTAGRSVSERRVAAGFPIEGMGQSELGRVWENLADYSFMSKPAKDVSSERYPWVSKLDPETPVYGGIKQDTATELAFDHIVDVLRGDLASGRIRPEQLSKMSMDQAVRRTYEYDIEMARKAEKAQLEANKAYLSQEPHKEYPSGYKWIKLPDPAASPENMKIVKDIGCKGGWCTQQESNARRYGEHSSGNALHVLLDPTGRPHIQIHSETNAHPIGFGGPSGQFPERDRFYYGLFADPPVSIPKEKMDQIYSRARLLRAKGGWENDTMDYFQQAANEILGELPRNITQIKPFSNYWESQMVQDFTAKNPNYRQELEPYIQDFVRSGKWGEIGDLKNTGLEQYGPHYFNAQEAEAHYKPLVQDALNFLETHPLLERHRAARKARNDFKGDTTSQEYRDLERQAGESIAPGVPYTYAELKALLSSPEDWAERGETIYRPISTAVEQIEKAKKALGPAEGMKAGGEVKMDKGGDAKKKVIDDFWKGMKESVPQRSELGPLDMLKQNLEAAYEGAKKVPGNLYKLATDPVGYAKSLPAPTGDQIINAFGPADMGFVGSYRPSTPLKPDPTVGTRYKVTDQGGLVPRQNLDIEQLQGSQAKIFPWDATSRNKLVTEVSEVPLKKPVLTEGGDEYMMDVQHVKNRIAGASNEGIANRILDRIDQAAWENRQLGGTGKVYGFPVRMGEGAEFFSTFPADIVMDFIGQGALNKKELAALTKDLRTMNFLGKKAPLAGAAPVGTPEFEMQLREGVKKGKNTPAVTPGNLRKGLMNRLGMVEYQERMGYNLPDLQGAVIAENLKGVPKGYVGNVVAELDPGAKLRPSKSSSYSHDFSGQYAGSMPNQPVEFLMPNTYEVIYREMKKEYPDASQTALRNMTIGAMEKRKESISELIGQRSIDAVKTYQEGLKKGEFDPNNIQEVYDYMRRKKLELKLKKGGPVETKSGLLKVKRKK